MLADAEAPNLQGQASIVLAEVFREAGLLHEATVAAHDALRYERKGNVVAAAAVKRFVAELEG
jgi:hypothetical protein